MSEGWWLIGLIYEYHLNLLNQAISQLYHFSRFLFSVSHWSLSSFLLHVSCHWATHLHIFHHLTYKVKILLFLPSKGTKPRSLSKYPISWVSTIMRECATTFTIRHFIFCFTFIDTSISMKELIYMVNKWSYTVS